MTYTTTKLDERNKAWFENDNTRATLAIMRLTDGNIRGLTPFEVSFDYPISAFSGANGSGKSTILALAACAFHNIKGGFTPPLRLRNYYTFQDFFIQSAADVPVDGVSIHYGIRHNNWKHSPPGLRFQIRKKKKGGKWNDYDSRVKRNVIYFGVQRVVPHYERSVHKSYKIRFKPGGLEKNIRDRIASIASRIIGKEYTDFDSYEHSKYSLPCATSGGISYSGFNMGAGESAIFEILVALFQSGPGTLLVIDEIELGLHELAQIRFIEQIKELCNELKCQVICSTHSYAILSNLPPIARFHVEKIGGSTFITKGISAAFACGKMGKPNATELDVFVEDSVAKEILEAAMPVDMRRRTRIKTIGSHAAVMRQMASRYLEDIYTCVSVLDGDQAGTKAQAIKIIENSCEASDISERTKITEWADPRICYLPDNVWPERWVIGTAMQDVDNGTASVANNLIQIWNLNSLAELRDALDKSYNAEKHNEFRDLSRIVDLPEAKVRSDIISIIVKEHREVFSSIFNVVESKLP